MTTFAQNRILDRNNSGYYPERPFGTPENLNDAFSKIIAGFGPESAQQEPPVISAAIKRAIKKVGASITDIVMADEIYRRTTNPDIDDPVYYYDGVHRFGIAIFDLACSEVAFLHDQLNIADVEANIRLGAGALAMQALRLEFPLNNY